MTAPAYRYRSGRKWPGGRPARKRNAVDRVRVDRACSGERMDLTAAERREAVRLLASSPGSRPAAPPSSPGQLAPMSANEIARRLDMSWRAVQRHRAAQQRETGARHLTARELEVLVLIAEGFGNKDIGAQLHVSPKTIARHVEHIMQALEARSRTQAAVMAVRAGLV